MTDQERIMTFIRAVGPTIPSKVAKQINTQILLASAHLSDLSAQGKVKISSLKVGGTPLYYLPGQESQLYGFAAGNLNPKDFQVLELLRDRKVLREKDLDLLSKVALRNLKDFAMPMQVTTQDRTELFWRWHTLSDEELKIRIAEVVNAAFPAPPQPVMEVQPPEEEIKPVIPEPLPIAAVPEVKSEVKAEIKQEIKEEEIFTPVEVKDEKQKTLTSPLVEKKKPGRKKAPITNDEFLPILEQFCDRLKISIEQREVLRKNTEINLVVKVPSVVGKMTYFCKAKNKTRYDEKDLSSAYVEAQMKKLPLLFLYNTEFNKKAQEMLGSGAFENVVVKKIE